MLERSSQQRTSCTYTLAHWQRAACRAARAHTHVLHPDSHIPPWHTSLPSREMHAAMLVLGMQIHFVGATEPSLPQPAVQQWHGESSAGCSTSEALVHP